MNRILSDFLKYQKKASKRKDDGVFVVEGRKMFEEAPLNRIKAVVLSESFDRANPDFRKHVEENFARIGRAIRIETVRDADFERASDTKSPQGVMALVERFSYTPEELLEDETGVFMMLDSVQDPGNVGTIFRSAEAAGASGIFLNQACADVYNPKVIRSTMGSVFRMKFCVVDSMDACIDRFHRRGGRVYAAHLQGEKRYDEVDYRGLSAILVGNESKGLKDEIAALADEKVRIPMLGKTESLNVAMASTVFLYETLRQRKTGESGD